MWSLKLPTPLPNIHVIPAVLSAVLTAPIVLVLDIDVVPGAPHALPQRPHCPHHPQRRSHHHLILGAST